MSNSTRSECSSEAPICLGRRAMTRHCCFHRSRLHRNSIRHSAAAGRRPQHPPRSSSQRTKAECLRRLCAPHAKEKTEVLLFAIDIVSQPHDARPCELTAECATRATIPRARWQNAIVGAQRQALAPQNRLSSELSSSGCSSALRDVHSATTACLFAYWLSAATTPLIEPSHGQEEISMLKTRMTDTNASKRTEPAAVQFRSVAARHSADS